MSSCGNPACAGTGALASLSQTQFGRAALERHGHNPMDVEQARSAQAAFEKAAAKNNAAFDADVRVGNIQSNGVINKDKNGQPLNNPVK